MLKNAYGELKIYLSDAMRADFGVKMVLLYIIFSYMRPQAIIPALNFLPWTQITILSGLGFAFLKSKVRIDVTISMVFMFALICTTSAYLSEYSAWSTSRLNVIYTWLIEMIFFISCVRSTKDFKLVIVMFFLVMFKISWFGARTWVERGFGFRDYGISGPPGFFTNSGELSLIIAMLCLWSAGYLVSQRYNKLFWALPITSLMTVLAASSRGSQLALLVGIVWLFLRMGKLSFRNLIIFIVILFSAWYLLPEQQKERFTSAGEDNTSTSRLFYWGKGIDMVQNHPWFGVGYYSFPQHLQQYYASELPEGKSWARRQEVAHNSFIEVASGTGYIGLSCYVILLWIVYKQVNKTRELLRKEKREAGLQGFMLGSEAALVCFLVGSSFMSVAFYPYVYFMLMLSSTLLFSVRQDSMKIKKELSEA